MNQDMAQKEKEISSSLPIVNYINELIDIYQYQQYYLSIDLTN
jgi:hypothetical protein